MYGLGSILGDFAQEHLVTLTGILFVRTRSNLFRFDFQILRSGLAAAAPAPSFSSSSVSSNNFCSIRSELKKQEQEPIVDECIL
jgi:hypothetical protein